MKAIYLSLSIIFTALILILSFGNIGAQFTQMHFLFFPVDLNPSVTILLISAIGIITGALYHAFIVRVLSSGEEEEDEL